MISSRLYRLLAAPPLIERLVTVGNECLIDELEDVVSNHEAADLTTGALNNVDLEVLNKVDLVLIFVDLELSCHKNEQIAIRKLGVKGRERMTAHLEGKALFEVSVHESNSSGLGVFTVSFSMMLWPPSNFCDSKVNTDSAFYGAINTHIGAGLTSLRWRLTYVDRAEASNVSADSRVVSIDKLGCRVKNNALENLLVARRRAMRTYWRCC